MRSLVTALIVSAMLAGPAAAQTPALRLTLEEAQTRAVQTSHRLAELRAREAAADAAIEIRRLMDRPTINASAAYTRTNHVQEFTFPGPGGVARVLYPDVPDNYRTRVDLQWPIYTGGRADALERAARAESAAAAADVAVARKDLRLEVARAFWALVTARATVSVIERGVERAEAHVRDVDQRLAVGLVPPNEPASAEAQASRARLLLIEAVAQRDLAAADLLRLIGAEPSADAVEPVAELEAPDLAIGTTPSAIAEARNSRDERRAISLRIDAGSEQVAAIAAARRPAIALAAGADYARPNPRIFPRADQWDDSWEVGLGVTWSLWDGGRSAADAAQAAQVVTAARHRLAEFDSLLGLEVRRRTLELESGRAAVRTAADGIRAAAEARRVVTERYRVGVIAQGDVLDADLALLQAELDRTRALAGVRLAEARLARALGR